MRCAYVSGAEGIEQIRLRATRLGLRDAPVQLAAATSVRNILTSLDSAAPTDIIVVDSIQTMYLDTLDSAPGTVTQVRAAAQELIRCAKRSGSVLLVVGHVTKDGQIAGPRVLEHMVDAVLYFEGERGHQFRILRSVKNRFGATDEIGATAVEVVHPLRDFHVTLLHLLGLDDNKLTYFHAGRYKQLSQFGGNVIKELIA